MKRYFPNLSMPVLALTLLLGARSASAGVTTYPDFTSWSAAVSGVTTVTIPDPAPAEDIYIGTGNASVTYGSLTFSQSAVPQQRQFFQRRLPFFRRSGGLIVTGADDGDPQYLDYIPQSRHRLRLQLRHVQRQCRDLFALQWRLDHSGQHGERVCRAGFRRCHGYHIVHLGSRDDP